MKLTAGLKFTSIHFRMKAEIKEIREKENEVDVMLTSTEGNSWIEKNWNLEHLKWGFEKGEYSVAEIDKTNYSVW